MPKRSLICEVKTCIAAPAVNPLTKVSESSEHMIPIRKTNIVNCHNNTRYTQSLTNTHPLLYFHITAVYYRYSNIIIVIINLIPVTVDNIYKRLERNY